MHRRAHRLVVRHKVWLEAPGGFALGDGGVALLAAIDATGSIRAGVQRVGWSYRHALSYLANAEAAVGGPLVRRARGGPAGGGASLTPDGRAFVRRYGRFRRELDRAVHRLYRTAIGGSGR
ncbi:MAG: winged helix-turn-helix domain-containing protein [Candidatus Rokuibacteriota bacterium]